MQRWSPSGEVALPPRPLFIFKRSYATCFTYKITWGQMGNYDHAHRMDAVVICGQTVLISWRNDLISGDLVPFFRQ